MPGRGVVGGKSVSSTTYYNLMGISSDKPFSGVNIKVTRYTDGSITKSKMMK
ncbi:MAG: hypothetical protein Q4E41_05570 [Bacteroidales bacterium]|nr:hypothetical protein [Bacteroidales bacterium]